MTFVLLLYGIFLCLANAFILFQAIGLSGTRKYTKGFRVAVSIWLVGNMIFILITIQNLYLRW